MNKSGDRIWQMYDGEFGEVGRQQARTRIHWICEQVKPNRVLDLGCSQGVCDILLAREGLNVTGIDLDQDAIEYAKNRLAQEESSTQQRVKFLHMNFMDYKLEDGEFDTVILSEVLEHLLQPEMALEKACKLLKDEGCLIVSVPFGINDWPDHKRTYYISSLLQQLERFISIHEIKFFSEWVACTGTKCIEKKNIEINLDFLAKVEHAFYSLERPLRDKVKDLMHQIQEGKTREKDWEKKYEILKQEMKQTIDLENQKQSELQEQLKKIEGELIEEQTLRKKCEEKWQKSEDANSQLEKRNRCLVEEKQQLEEIKQQLEKANQNFAVEKQQLEKKNQYFAEEKLALKNQHEKEKYIISIENKELKETLKVMTNASEAQKKQQTELNASWQAKYVQVQKDLANIQTNYNLLEQNRQRWIKEYEILASSKLGCIQRKIWILGKKRADSKRCRIPLAARLKESLKQFPFLVKLARFLRSIQVAEKPVASPVQNTAAASISEPNREPASSMAAVSGITPENCKQKLMPDMNYYERIREQVEQIPCSNGSRYYTKIAYRLGWITDVILYDAFKSAAEGILLTPDNWEKELNNIDLLFIISGWHGIHNEWNGFAREGSPKRQIIYKVIQQCKAADIPTVFYSVEDPPNFDRFIGIAQKVDYVFTAAIEMLPKYKEMCGHDRIYQLSYGIDPLLHNPIGMRKFPKQKEVFFAGSWMEKYPERGKDLKVLFDGVLRAGRKLKIIDRNLLLSQQEYRFPKEYTQYLSPPLDHEVLQRVHKLYDWAININSVKESATMFANRTYELQAMGNLMLSNYSVGVNSKLPLIFTTQHSEEVPSILNCLTNEEIYAHQVAGVRFAMHGNTCYERMAEILGRIGKLSELPQHHVAVVVKEKTKRIIQTFQEQSYPYKSLITEDELRNHYTEYDIIAFFDGQAEYGNFYLEDMINGFKYTNSDYITKAGYYSGHDYIPGVEHDYVTVMGNKSRTIFWRKSYNADFLLEINGSCSIENGYSIDHFQYNESPICNADDKKKYILSTIVPVYNNGLHLYGKAFNSLRRSSIFKEMEILLVDDGSTDPYTICIVQSLAKQYPNVKAYFFNDGGSGSASRPRNKGVEMSTAPYITFLDPDNEAVNDAYASMLKLAIEENDDIVVGNMSRFRLKEELANYHYYFKKLYKSEYVEGDKKEFLSKINFTPMSIQAMIIKKSVITRSGISQVIGAVGQDSFFSWQLFTSASKIHSVETVAHIYYAMVQDSTVNTISSKYFERSFIQEHVQRDWLVKMGLFEDYMKKRFIVFFRDWYLKKLEQAKPGEEENCARILWEIFKLYQNGYKGEDNKINEFVKQMR